MEYVFLAALQLQIVVPDIKRRKRWPGYCCIFAMDNQGRDVKPIDRFAIWMTDTLGTLWFLYGVLIVLLFYVLWNTGLIGLKPFDHYPFDGLDTFLSMFAVVLSITVLISQNRQRRLEKIREEVEFKINVQAEHEVTKILEMLHEIQRKLGINHNDPELEKMKETTNLEALHREASEEQQE